MRTGQEGEEGRNIPRYDDESNWAQTDEMEERQKVSGRELSARMAQS